MANNSESNKIASNTLVQIAGRIIVLGLSLITLKLITNYLGPQGAGFYNTVITYFSFVLVIAEFGVFSVAVREASKNPDRARRLFANVFTIRLISALTFTALALITTFLTNYPREIKLGILIASLFPVFNLLASVYDMLFQYKLEMQKVVGAEVIAKILAVTAVAVVAKFELGYYLIVATVPFAVAAAFALKALISRKELPFRLAWDKHILMDIVRMALPVGLFYIFNNLYFRINILILFYFKGPVDVGIYFVANRVLETTLFGGLFLSASLKPLLSSSIFSDRPRAEKAVSHAVNFLVFMSLSITIMCVAFSREIILFLSNDQYLGAAPALVILGFASILMYVGSVIIEIFIALDMRRELIGVSLLVLAFNVALNILLIPRYSFIGAAYVTLLSEGLFMAVSVIIIRKVIRFYSNWLNLAKLTLTAAGAVGIGFALRYLGIHFVISLAASIGFYVGSSYLLHAIPRSLVNRYLASLITRFTPPSLLS